MFRLINSLQLVGLFVAMPWLVGWLWSGPFWRADYLAYIAGAVYIALCFLMIAAVYNLSENWK